MLGRDQRRLVEPKLQQFVRKVALMRRVGLVRRHHDRPPRPAQQLRDVTIDRGQALADVEQQDDHVGLVDRDPRLRLDGGARRVLGVIEVQPGRVDDGELAAPPFGDAVEPIPRQP